MLANFSWLEPNRLAGCSQPGGYWSDEGQNWAKITADLRQLFASGIRVVVSLTERPLPEELVRAEGMEYLHLPVPDMHPPKVEDVFAFTDFIHKKEQPVVVHCQAGLGRTGTILACYLVYNGVKPGEAIQQVRQMRPGSVETDEQEAVVSEYASHLEKMPKGVVGS